MLSTEPHMTKTTNTVCKLPFYFYLCLSLCVLLGKSVCFFCFGLSICLCEERGRRKVSPCQKETGTNYAQNSVSTVDIAGVSTLVYTTPQPQPFSRSSPTWQTTLFCQLILQPIVWHGVWKLFWCVLNCVGSQFVCLVCLYALWNPVKSNSFPRICTLWAPVPIPFNLECIHQTFESLQLCLRATQCPLQPFSPLLSNRVQIFSQCTAALFEPWPSWRISRRTHPELANGPALLTLRWRIWLCVWPPPGLHHPPANVGLRK